MNLTVTLVGLILLVLPGYVFRTFLYLGSSASIRLKKSSLNEEIFYSVGFAFFFHWIALVNPWLNPDVRVWSNIFSGETAFQDNDGVGILKNFLAYVFYVTSWVALVGFVANRMILVLRLAHVHPIFRFYDELYYQLRGFAVYDSNWRDALSGYFEEHDELLTLWKNLPKEVKRRQNWVHRSKLTARIFMHKYLDGFWRKADNLIPSLRGLGEAFGYPKPDAVFGTFLVGVGSRSFVYEGVIVDTVINSSEQLEQVTLGGAARYELRDELLPFERPTWEGRLVRLGRDPEDLASIGSRDLERRYTFEFEQLLVLRAEEIKNFAIQYLVDPTLYHPDLEELYNVEEPDAVAQPAQ